MPAACFCFQLDSRPGGVRRQGVQVTAEEIARAEPRARKQLDEERTIGTTTDASRGWLFFDLILEQAGAPLTPQTAAALRAARLSPGERPLGTRAR